MTTALLASAISTMKRVGPGQLYMVPAPAADPGTTASLPATDTTAAQKTEAGYFSLFYGAASADIRRVITGVSPWATLDNTGLDLKIKPSTVKFDSNTAPVYEMVTGIETATADFTFFELEPAHLVDMFGSQASDLMTIAAAAGNAGRQIALLGSQSYNNGNTVLYRFPSSVIPGEFVHYLFPWASMMADLEIKMSKKDEMKAKVTLQLQPSPFLFNSAGNGVVVITDDPNVAHL